VKIGPVDIEMALLIVKKEEIKEGKIYSPVGRFAERAKQGAQPLDPAVGFAPRSPVLGQSLHYDIYMPPLPQQRTHGNS